VRFQLGAKAIVEKDDFSDGERSNVDVVVARDLENHLSVSELCAREMHVGAVAHDSVDYRLTKKKLANAQSAWKSGASSFEIVGLSE
jgi:hypothetical protein